MSKDRPLIMYLLLKYFPLQLAVHTEHVHLAKHVAWVGVRQGSGKQQTTFLGLAKTTL